ncbi:hypothetical protein NKW54_15335 [Acetobacter cerevisiae]|uniref:Bacterial mobilisation domain-containing protein n=1 Tax=Acetobacter cerevisiae TaxID=178900 RepID=A0ABT1EY78_9PROT|nr:hypothetical protein [Acetobacter cerevisiae]MCP1247284.1 hypothetical protein [Acetobacter cerevisiae]MCP1256835.1 hypothetical protein [Acetobacter cerevisiae]
MGTTRPVSTGIRTTAAERDQWTALAVSMGHRGLGSWLRALAYQAAIAGDDGRAIVTILTSLRGEMRRVGQNLNQAVTVGHVLAKHGTPYPPLADQVAETRQAISDTVSDLNVVLRRLKGQEIDR